MTTAIHDEGYAFGDRQFATAWAQYGLTNAVSVSLRGAFTSQKEIEDIDAAIVAPVQTADPDFQGGDRLDVGFGANLAPQDGALEGRSFGVEMIFPAYQDLNGPQLETDWALTAGWRTTF